MVHISCSSCLVISMGTFLLGVGSGNLPAMFFLKIWSHIFMIFEVELE